MAALLASLTVAALVVPARAGDLRRDCQAWTNSAGLARVDLANRIGAENMLTKNRNFAEAVPGDPKSLYNNSDIRRLCASY